MMMMMMMMMITFNIVTKHMTRDKWIDLFLPNTFVFYVQRMSCTFWAAVYIVYKLCGQKPAVIILFFVSQCDLERHIQ